MYSTATRCMPGLRNIFNPYPIQTEMPLYYCFKEKCRSGKKCEAIQKTLKCEDTGTTPPPYNVSSVLTEAVEYTNMGDYENKKSNKYSKRKTKPINMDNTDSLLKWNNSSRPLKKNKSIKYQNKAFDKNISAYNETRIKDTQHIAYGDTSYTESAQRPLKYNFKEKQTHVKQQCGKQPCCTCRISKANTLPNKIKTKSLSLSKSLGIKRRSNKPRFSFSPKSRQNMVKIEIKPKGMRPENVKENYEYCKDGLCTDFEICSESLTCQCKYRQTEYGDVPILRTKNKSLKQPQRNRLHFLPVFKNKVKQTSKDGDGDTFNSEELISKSDEKYCKGGLCTDYYKCSKSATCECDVIKTKIDKKKKNYCECKNDLIENKKTANEADCEKGLCVNARKNKNENFFCNCSNILPLQCSDDTCDVAKHCISTRTLIKIKEKGVSFFNKCSEMLTNKSIQPESNTDVCKRGICKTAKNRNKEFICSCVKNPQINECFDETCNPKSRKYTAKSTKMLTLKSNNYESGDSFSSVKQKFRNYYHCVSSKLSGLISKTVTLDRKFKILQNQGEQTGEAFFELKVDPLNMCVLNSEEIKEKMDKFEKCNYCICPSHKKEKLLCLKKLACPEGQCQKAYKDKSTNFICECKKIQGECTDTTCIINKPIKAITNSKPLFDVEMDSGTMCIVNSDDMRETFKKISESKSSPNVCKSGICQEAVAKKRSVVCKCVKRLFVANECSSNTCKSNRNINDIKHKSKPWPVQDKTKKGTKLRTHENKAMLEETSKGKFGNCIIKILKRRKKRKKGDMFKGHMFKGHVLKTDDIKSKSQNKGTIPCRCNPRSPKSFLSSSNLFFRKSQQNKRFHYNAKERKIHKRSGLLLPPYSNKGVSNVTSEQPKKKSSNLLGRHKRKTLSLPIGNFKNTSNNRNIKTNDAVCMCNEIKRTSRYSPKNKKDTCTSNQIQRNKVKVDHLRQNKKDVMTSKTREQKKVNGQKDNVCMCNHICACFSKKGKKKPKNKQKKVKKRAKRVNPKKKNENKKKAKETLAEEKKFRKERIKKLKIERKKKKKMMKIQKKELEELMKGKEGAEERSCLADCTLGIVKFIGVTIKETLRITFCLIFQPKKSLIYIRDRLKDPPGTYERIKKFFWEYWQVKKLSMMKTTGGSETMSIFKDTFQNTAIYDAFANKGKTAKERRLFESKKRKRVTRIRKRKNEALFGCRHMLLTTLRKTPCLWVYHICPNFYAQFLSLSVFVRNFLQLLILLLAVVVWTPCILCCELCRAFLCCCVCTQ